MRERWSAQPGRRHNLTTNRYYKSRIFPPILSSIPWYTYQTRVQSHTKGCSNHRVAALRGRNTYRNTTKMGHMGTSNSNAAAHEGGTTLFMYDRIALGSCRCCSSCCATSNHYTQLLAPPVIQELVRRLAHLRGTQLSPKCSQHLQYVSCISTRDSFPGRCHTARRVAA